jgi:sterol desaturase/sphingolipid hydroxylase (fatty acid hydroxylase superfamily)
VSGGLEGLLGVARALADRVQGELAAVGLSPLRDLARDTYLSPYIMLFAVPLWFTAGRLWPAERPKTPVYANVSLDFLYPLFSLPVRATLVAGTVAFVTQTLSSLVPRPALGLLDHQSIAVQGIGAFLITDLMFWIAHYLKHKVRFLWHFHAIHHSQRYVNPLTTYRNHPCELIINAVIKAIPLAIVGGTYPTWFWFTFLNDMWGFFLHANLRMSLGPLNWVIVTPQNHRLHHTIEPELIDRNFGERLVLWDWLFGTLHRGFDTYTPTGVPECVAVEERAATAWGLVSAFLRQLLYPFRMLLQDAQRALSR